MENKVLESCVCILNPLDRVKLIFDECNLTDQDWKSKVSNSLIEDLSKPEIYKKIPLLNETPLDKLVPHQLVRFRCMVQDMLDHEFYSDTYKLTKEDGSTCIIPGRYRDVSPVCRKNEKIDVCEGSTDDRYCYFCISIPGESKWVKEKLIALNPAEETCVPNHRQGTKRSINEEAMNETSDTMNECDGSYNEGSKKLKSKLDLLESSKETLNRNNFPLTDSEGKACIVKIYSDVDLKLNEIIDVIGVLSIDPHLDSSNMLNDEDENLEERIAHSPPPSLIPRLHCITFKTQSHIHPDLPVKLDESYFQSSQDTLDLRELFGSILETALLGDGIAAEYLLCHLVSSVYYRKDVLPLGKFSLNLSGIKNELQDQNYTAMLYELIETITTHSYFMNMTLQFMNETDFIPKKDYEANRLTSGLLQLPSSLHLVIDETKLTAGKLDVNGVKNLTALGQLVKWQKVEYDFQFYPLEQHTDVPVLILSEGKSMITCDCHLSLEAKHTDVSLAFSKVYSMLNEQVLDNVRKQLVLSRLAPYNLTDDMQTRVQQDFVESRKNEDGMSADDLHFLLTLAKLIAQGCGKSELSDDVWRSAKALESTRKGRLRN